MIFQFIKVDARARRELPRRASVDKGEIYGPPIGNAMSALANESNSGSRGAEGRRKGDEEVASCARKSRTKRGNNRPNMARLAVFRTLSPLDLIKRECSRKSPPPCRLSPTPRRTLSRLITLLRMYRRGATGVRVRAKLGSPA